MFLIHEIPIAAADRGDYRRQPSRLQTPVSIGFCGTKIPQHLEINDEIGEKPSENEKKIMIIHIKKAHKYFFPHYFFSIFTPLKLSAEQDHLVHEKNIFIVKDQRDKNLSIMISDHLSIKHLLCSARTLSLSLQIQSFRCHSRQALS